MALRIERLWGSMFGTGTIQSKRDQSKGGQQQQLPNDQQNPKQEDKEERKATREQIEKAVAELKAEGSFSHTGMKVEVIETSQSGLQVKLIHASGSVIKLLSAEEFLKLRENSATDNGSRGKILDQKF